MLKPILYSIMCCTAVISTPTWAASTIINSDAKWTSNKTVEGLEVGPSGHLSIEADSSTPPPPPTTVNVSNNILVAGGSIDVTGGTTLNQTTPNDTQGLLIRNNGSVSVAEKGTLSLKSKIDLASGSSLSNSGTVSTTNEIIIQDSTLSISDGNMSSQSFLEANNANINLSGSVANLNINSDVKLTNSTVSGNKFSNFYAGGDITATNTNFNGGSVYAQKDFFIRNQEGGTVSNATLQAQNNLTFTGNATSSFLSAKNITVNGNVSGTLHAAQTINYETGSGVLGVIGATNTNVHAPADLTLAWGRGTSNINADGKLNFDNFKLTGSVVANNNVNMSWNNEIEGNLTLNDTSMQMTKSSHEDGWLKVHNLTVNKSDLNIDSTFIQSSGTVDIGNNSNVTMRVSGPVDNQGYNYGHIIANTINIGTQTKLNMVLDNGALSKGQSESYQLLDANTINGHFTSLSKNNRYTFIDKGNGLFEITNIASGGDIAEEVTKDDSIRDMASAWLDGEGFDENSPAFDIADHLNSLSQSPDKKKEYGDALNALAPTRAPYVTALASDMTRQLFHAIGTHYAHDFGRGSQKRLPKRDSALWAQGITSSATFDGNSTFDTKTNGGVIGLDTKVFNGARFGIGYGYTMSDIDANDRKADVTSHSGIVYADFAGEEMYLDTMFSFTRSAFEENKDVSGIPVKADYDVDIMAAQAMLGYDLGTLKLSKKYKTGHFVPEIGARYILVKQHEYTDSADQTVGSADASTATGVLGGHYTLDYRFGPVVISPDLKAAVTYDFVQDDLESIVRLPNGLGYRMVSERLDPLGIELGAEIGMSFARRIDLAFSYLGMFRKDFTDHTGFANLKYHF